ncbi:GNAT family N-acetyltransferase [Vibrio paucivorans]
MELVVPNKDWQQAFSRFYLDFARLDPDNADYYRQGLDDFQQYVQRLCDEANGVNLRHGYVPCSHFWLTNEQQILGAIRIRHNIDNEFLAQEAGHIGYDVAPSYRRKGYGKTMLGLVLAQAKALGLERVLITADEGNVASRRVIEANGGVFENVVTGKVFAGPLARYWIQL